LNIHRIILYAESCIQPELKPFPEQTAPFQQSLVGWVGLKFNPHAKGNGKDKGEADG
jgi:hypothetical protein